MPWYITGYLVMLAAQRGGDISLSDLVELARKVGSMTGEVYIDAEAEVRRDLATLEMDGDVKVMGDRVVPTGKLTRVVREVEDVAAHSPILARILETIARTVNARG